MKPVISIGNREFNIYIESTHIQARINELAEVISADYAQKEPLVISVLNGAFMFTADLLRSLDLNCNLTFIRLSSYQGTDTTGLVKTIMGLNERLENRDIILVEDIVDTGITLQKLLEQILNEKPASLRVCALLVKPDKHQVPVNVDYIGFTIPDNFVVGYGLDLDGQGRNLPHIYQLKS